MYCMGWICNVGDVLMRILLDRITDYLWTILGMILIISVIIVFVFGIALLLNCSLTPECMNYWISKP